VRLNFLSLTLLELTCYSIAEAIKEHCFGAKEIYLCGGGARNAPLYNRIAALLPECHVNNTGVLGIDSDYIEATAFAWLAQQNLHGKSANLPLAQSTPVFLARFIVTLIRLIHSRNP
jgi:anhydro-N-acetylmuramic acid kinase